MPQRRSLLQSAGASATLAALSALAGLGTARGAWAQTLPQPLPGSLTAHNPTTHNPTTHNPTTHNLTTHNLTERELAALNNLSPDGVRVDFPRLADTGAAVPLEAVLQAPAGTRIARIDVYLPLNPNTHALKMSFPEPVTAYRFATRLRLPAPPPSSPRHPALTKAEPVRRWPPRSHHD
jgi:predicted secreted protein